MISRAARPLRSRTSGQSTSKLKTLIEAPGAIATLAAVLGVAEIERRRVIALARTRGLITGRDSNWHTNRTKLNTLFRSPRLRLYKPTPAVVYGLGELLARGHGAQAPEFRTLKRLTGREVCQLLNALTQIAQKVLPRKAYTDVTCKNVVRAVVIDRAVCQRASAFLRFPPRSTVGLYGYSHAIFALLICHPHITIKWLSHANLSAEIYTVIVSRVIDSLIYRNPSECRSIAYLLLRTGVPFFQALGACSLAGEDGNENGIEFAQLVIELQSLGIRRSQAFTLSLIVVETARARRARVESKITEFSARLVQLEKYPDTAIGGSRNADDETEQVRHSLETAQAEKRRVDQDFDKLVSALASVFNTEPTFVSRLVELQGALMLYAPEVLVRVGEYLGAGQAAEAILDFVIDVGVKVIGLSAPTFGDDGNLTRKDFESIRAPMARAIDLRYRSDVKGVGRRTGQLLAELAQVGDRLLNAPYSAERWPLQYRRALRRRMASVLLAFDVAKSGTPDEQSMKATLAKIAIEQAELLLTKERPDIDSEGFGEEVTLVALDIMQAGLASDRRAQWRQDIKMDAFSRAIAIWSDPVVALSDKDMARSLFLQCTESTICRIGSLRPLIRALNLLDVTFASVIRDKKSEVLPLLKLAWEEAIQGGRIKGANSYADSFDVLCRAVRDDNGVEELLRREAWKNSRTVNLLTSLRTSLA